MGTDKKVVEFIKQTLEEYEEDYIPGAWENFVDKRKKRNKIIIWRLGTGIAASFMLGWMFFHFYHIMQSNSQVSDEKKITTNETHINIPEKKSETKESRDNSSGLTGKKPSDAKNSFSLALKSLEGANSPQAGPVSKRIGDFKGEIISPDTNKYEGHFGILPDTVQGASDKQAALFREKIDSSEVASEINKTGDSTKNMFMAEQAKLMSENESIENGLAVKHKIRFGINLSPGVNSTQTASSKYFSGGINTSIALNRNFELSTGLQFVQQRVVNNTHPDNTSVPRGKSRADLVNLDLPVNITWKFFSNKSKSYYISGGLSSLAYLSENYENTTYTQEVEEIVTVVGGQEIVRYELVNVESTTQNSVSSFQTFDFAGRVNIIFGLEQYLSGKMSLHIEPYLKIPLSGLATENLKFTTSGITCKISF